MFHFLKTNGNKTIIIFTYRPNFNKRLIFVSLVKKNCKRIQKHVNIQLCGNSINVPLTRKSHLTSFVLKNLMRYGYGQNVKCLNNSKYYIILI